MRPGLLAAATVLFLGLSGSAEATTGCNGQGVFYDNWGCGMYYSPIQWLHEEGFAEGEPREGHPDTVYFSPERPINRAEFTKLVMLVAGYDALPACTANPFPDVSADAWFASYICAAKELGIIAGFPDGTFQPAKHINYASASKILVEALGVTHDPSLVEYFDDQQIWYRPYVSALIDKNAVPPTVEAFDQLLTRAEMAHLLYSLKAEEPYTDYLVSNPDAEWNVGTGYSWYGMEDDLGIYIEKVPDQPFYFSKTTSTIWDTLPELNGYRFFHTAPTIHCSLSGLWEHCKPQLIDWSIALFVTDADLTKAKEMTLIEELGETFYFGGRPGECSTLGVEGENTTFCFVPLEDDKTLIVERDYIDSSVVYLDVPGITPLETSNAWFARIRTHMKFWQP